MRRAWHRTWAEDAEPSVTPRPRPNPGPRPKPIRTRVRKQERTKAKAQRTLGSAETGPDQGPGVAIAWLSNESLHVMRSIRGTSLFVADSARASWLLLCKVRLTLEFVFFWPVGIYPPAVPW